VVEKATAALTSLFATRRTSIGLKIAQSDIFETINTCTSNINYTYLRSPTHDLSTAIEILKDATGTLTTGTLTAGNWQFYYTFTPIMFDKNAGESLPILISLSDSGYNDTGTAGYVLNIPSWSLYGATIKIYSVYTAENGSKTTRRIYNGVPTEEQFRNGLTVTITSPSMGTIATLPNIDKSGMYYNVLGDVTLNVYSTDRKQLTYRSGV
jgi:hypothetical protein